MGKKIKWKKTKILCLPTRQRQAQNAVAINQRFFLEQPPKKIKLKTK